MAFSLPAFVLIESRFKEFYNFFNYSMNIGIQKIFKAIYPIIINLYITDNNQSLQTRRDIILLMINQIKVKFLIFIPPAILFPLIFW